MDYLETLAIFAKKVHFKALPPEVRQQTAWVLADTLGAIVAGSAEPELRSMVQRIGYGEGAVLPGLGRTVQAELAALVNGTGGTFLEMDEGNRFSRGHPAIHVLPAVLALCEQRKAGADAFLSGFVTGYEVGSRLGAASMLRGSMHPHGTWGTLGAAAGCARVLGADTASMRETLNVASSMTTATSKKTMLQGGLVRNLYAGLSNYNGMLASQLVPCGFTGEHDGPGSLFGSIVSEHFDREAVLRDLGEDWHLMHNYFKLHSCCRFNHGTLDAVDLLAQRGDLPAADDIARVQVNSYAYAAELSDPAPRNTLAAKFSVPFAVATRIVHGHSGMAAFSWDAVRNSEVLALAQCVQVTEDPAMTKRLPEERPARVEITDRQGRTHVAEVSVNRGDDAAPYSHAELRGKFLDLCSRVWPRAHAEEVLAATLNLSEAQSEDQSNQQFREWVALLQRPPVAA